MRRKSAVLWMTIALVLTIPGTSIAGDRFQDVPSSNIFHDDIGWLADQGVTRGCNPPTNDMFCPDDPVTREQMAAFMRRFADSLDAAAQPRLMGSEGPGVLLTEDTWTSLASFTINVPSGGGALLLSGTTGFFLENGSDLGAIGLIDVTVDQGCSDSADGIPAIWDTLSAGADSATAVGSLPISGGSHRIRLCAIALHVDTTERTEALGPRVSALWTADGQVSVAGATSTNNTSKTELLERAEATVGSKRNN